MAKPSVIDEIAAMIPERTGSRPWHERVTPEQAAMLDEILAAWHAGAFGQKRRTAARAIAAALQRQGIDIGQQGVDSWLQRSAK